MLHASPVASRNKDATSEDTDFVPGRDFPAYVPPRWLPGGHALTLFPPVFRPRPLVHVERERIATPDNDFLDLDWLRRIGPRPLAIVSHGLEGNSRRKYVAGMLRALAREGWDGLAWNQRGCSGEMNRTSKLYHSGQTDDLGHVVRHAVEKGYTCIALVGFSLGGNQILRYLAGMGVRTAPEVRSAAVFSVPCDLVGSSTVLDQPSNRIYMTYFLRTLRQKVRAKHRDFPDAYPLDGLGAIRTFNEFDDRYTAPVFGFAGAEDYWRKASSLPHLGRIRVPTLVVNALDDPFLSDSCYPRSAARTNPRLKLETPRRGGHVGFATPGPDNLYWSEARAAAFLRPIADAWRAGSYR